MTLEMWCVLDPKENVVAILPAEVVAWAWLINNVSMAVREKYAVKYAKVEVNW